MIDPFLILAPILLLAVVGLLQFVGCSFHPGVAPDAPDPTFDPMGGTYSGPISVSISDTDLSATIYYATGATSPAPPSGTVYSTALEISGPTTLNAIATDPNDSNSNVVSAVYNFVPIAFRQFTETFIPNGTGDTISTPAFNNPVDQGSLMILWIWYNTGGQNV